MLRSGGQDLVDGIAGEQLFQHVDGGLRVGGHAVVSPVQQDAGDAVGVKAGDRADLGRGEGGLAVGVKEQMGHQPLVEVHETLGKAVLPLKLEDVQVEVPVFLHVFAQGQQTLPPVDQRDVILEDRGDLGVEDPGLK